MTTPSVSADAAQLKPPEKPVLKTPDQFTLIGNAVDLEHHAVDLVRQAVAALADVAAYADGTPAAVGVQCPECIAAARAALPKRPLRLSQINQQERGVWQRGYWAHSISNQADYDLHLRCCQMDPVRHGVAERPEDWPYSSFAQAAALQLAG